MSCHTLSLHDAFPFYVARAPLCRFDFDLPLAELARVGDGDGAAIFDETIARAAVLVAAQVAGAGERILEFTVDYAKERVQFGVPIGQYQAVHYLCTDLVLHYRHTARKSLVEGTSGSARGDIGGRRS